MTMMMMMMMMMMNMWLLHAASHNWAWLTATTTVPHLLLLHVLLLLFPLPLLFRRHHLGHLWSSSPSSSFFHWPMQVTIRDVSSAAICYTMSISWVLVTMEMAVCDWLCRLRPATSSATGYWRLQLSFCKRKMNKFSMIAWLLYIAERREQACRSHSGQLHKSFV